MTTTEQQTGVVKATGPYPVPERFKEQLAIMPDSISAPIKEQLTLMPDSTVLEIYEGGHKTSVLYKTNAQSREANARQDSVRKENGANNALPIAKAKLGSNYVTEQGEVQQNGDNRASNKRNQIIAERPIQAIAQRENSC